MVYRDPSPINPKYPEYNKNDVDPRVANYTKQIREKIFGIDVREALARGVLEEVTKIYTEENSKEKSRSHLVICFIGHRLSFGLCLLRARWNLYKKMHERIKTDRDRRRKSIDGRSCTTACFTDFTCRFANAFHS